jgi:single-strand DNA-binding protein
MLVIGRITADAVVKQLKNDRQVVSFSIAENDWYKPKGMEQGIRTTTFYNCSYWLGTGVAGILKKGTLVEIAGRLIINAYSGFQGDAKASLNLHVSRVQVHQVPKAGEPVGGDVSVSPSAVQAPVEDLPF